MRSQPQGKDASLPIYRRKKHGLCPAAWLQPSRQLVTGELLGPAGCSLRKTPSFANSSPNLAAESSYGIRAFLRSLLECIL